MFPQELKYMKKNCNKLKKKKKWRRKIARKQIRFFFDSLFGRTTNGRNFAPRTKNEKDSKIIYKIWSEQWFRVQFVYLTQRLFVHVNSVAA